MFGFLGASASVSSDDLHHEGIKTKTSVRH